MFLQYHHTPITSSLSSHCISNFIQIPIHEICSLYFLHDQLQYFLYALPRILWIFRNRLPILPVARFAEYTFLYHICSFFLFNYVSFDLHIILNHATEPPIVIFMCRVREVETYFSTMLQQELIIPSPSITQITI